LNFWPNHNIEINMVFYRVEFLNDKIQLNDNLNI
jgi:hypothetical protein